MKTFIYSILTMVVVCCSFSACSSDDDADRTYTHTTTPEQEAQGVYRGTFTRAQANVSDAVREEGDGTLTISPTDTAYVAHVRFECTALGIAAETKVNITFANDGFLFSNDLASNTLGSPITGRISTDHDARSDFQLKIRQGRSTKTFDIVFSGKAE